ncbi:hypothetical protein N7474_000455 [Penicillium riverlandense]|uniref:uncharacterized protein n=1 Tax=Penicillium riverlandense TaxID=1903569 RepID=UPI0025495CFF|nr:uncharacterized protein N7474_000455 [Penicillium riverlandense]KAJ5832144.1 hypothetical protein N7474_000455 [Penicillium riverlandense]
MSSWSDLQEPPRKRMRKGTKSCTECRRRKIRCTSNSDFPGTCNECRLRGSTCIEQEHSPPTSVSSHQGEQTYSLRERVAHLENVVEGLVKRLDQNVPDTSSIRQPPGQKTYQTPNDLQANLTPASVESDELSPPNQIVNAPILQLFDSYLVKRQEDIACDDRFTGVKDMSPKAQEVRSRLISLLPPREDIRKIIDASSKWWFVWQSNFPELCDQCRDSSTPGFNMAPADVAKALVCLSISVAQMTDFTFNSLQIFFNRKQFVDLCISEVDRLVIRDDDLAATLPGIECQMLLSKYYMNDGRLRKAWLGNRRAIEFAQIAGMHASTRTPRPSDALYERRLKIWCSLVTSDRTLSLILGMPYVVTDAFILPQVEQRLAMKDVPGPEQYVLRVGIITGHMIDRSHDPAKASLSTTLKLDQDLLDAVAALPDSCYDASPCSQEGKPFHKHVPMQFMSNLLRAMLHLPFMLKPSSDSQYQYSHETAIQCARQGLGHYKNLRSTTAPYLGKVADFLAFILALLVLTHVYGNSEESPNYDKEQDQRDFALVRETIEILRRASTECGGSVAAESATILDKIFNVCNPSTADWKSFAHSNRTCKITVPYFGTITVGPGSKLLRKFWNNMSGPMLGDSSAPIAATERSSSEQTPNRAFTPPLSTSDGTAQVNGTSEALNFERAGYSEMLPSDNDLKNPMVDLNAFSGIFDELGQDMSLDNLNLDLGLDQGWDLNWSDV